jgi:hypothetical protein
MRNTTACTLAAAIAAVSFASAATAADYTPAGTQLSIGQAAILPLHIPYKAEAPVQITVTSIDAGTLADFTQYKVPPEAADTKPYYVHYHVKSLGAADVASNSMYGPIAIDDRNEKHNPTLTDSRGGGARFDRCKHDTFHLGAAQGAEYDSCEIFLIHQSGSLKAFGFELADTPYWKSPVLWLTAGGTAAPAQGNLVPGH